MTFLCFNCGYLNDESKESSCENCQTKIDKVSYNQIMTYSNRVKSYVFESKKVNEKIEYPETIRVEFSVVSPQNYFEFLIAAALAGTVGNLVYDIGKHVAKQIFDRLSNKQKNIELSQSEQDVFEIVSDEATLKKFIDKVQLFYKDKLPIEKEKNRDILIGEVKSVIIHNFLSEYLKAVEKKKGPDKEIGEKEIKVIAEAAAEIVKQKRKEKPNTQDLDKLFPELRTTNTKKNKHKKGGRKKR